MKPNTRVGGHHVMTLLKPSKGCIVAFLSSTILTGG
jgi:hypothetical protein